MSSLPMKLDKQALAIAMFYGITPYQFERTGWMHVNRLYSIIYKWSDLMWVDWGVSARHAWLTKEVRIALTARLNLTAGDRP
jgi:hypothetical protein